MMDISQEFPQRPEIVYLNHAGVAPWPVRTARAVRDFAEENVAQGAFGYRRWIETETQLRQQLARLIGHVSPDDIALLKSTSEGLSVVAHGLDWAPGDNVVVPREEFPSNRIVWESLERYGVEVRLVDLADGADPESALLERIDRHTRLLAASSVQYATGLRMDLARLGDACHDRDILFCVDAIQSLGALRVDAAAAGADCVIADGHKWMLGPEGVALFYCTPELRDRLQLYQYGWHMVEAIGDYERMDWTPAQSARRFECGSPNMLGIHALSTSLSLLEEYGLREVEERVLALSDELVELLASHAEFELVTPEETCRRAGIVTVRCPGLAGEQLVNGLRARGIVAASRVGGVRLSPHFYNTSSQLNHCIEELFDLSKVTG